MAIPSTNAHVLLIRHAECLMNLGLASHVGGRSAASPLTPLGQEQAKHLGCHLQQTVPGSSLRLFSSTAVRARETALAALDALQLPRDSLIQSEELLELEMGEWEGALRAECYTPAALAAIAADPHNFSPPGGESQLQVRRARRCGSAAACGAPTSNPDGTTMS